MLTRTSASRTTSRNPFSFRISHNDGVFARLHPSHTHTNWRTFPSLSSQNHPSCTIALPVGFGPVVVLVCPPTLTVCAIYSVPPFWLLLFSRTFASHTTSGFYYFVYSYREPSECKNSDSLYLFGCTTPFRSD